MHRFNPFVTEIWWRGGQRDGTTGHLFIDLTLSSPKFDDGGGHRNDAPWKQKYIGQIRSRQNMTDVEDDGTSEDGSPRPVCSIIGKQNEFKEFTRVTNVINIYYKKQWS